MFVCADSSIFYLVWYTVCLPYSRAVVVYHIIAVAFFVLILGLRR